MSDNTETQETTDVSGAEQATALKAASLLNQEDADRAAGGATTGRYAGTDADDGTEGSSAYAGAEVASEVYEPFSLPEGISRDEELETRFGEAAREAGLTQDQAQRLVDVYAERHEDSVRHQKAEWASTVEDWITELKNDPKFGGTAFERNVGIANKGLKVLFRDEPDFAAVTEHLNAMGLGTYPPLIRALHRLGTAASEQSSLARGVGETPSKSYEEAVYPTHFSKE